MAVNTQKLLPGSTFSTVKTNTENIKKQIDPKLNIYKKVVKIDKLLKNSFLIQSKEQSKEIKNLQNQKREKRENNLESPKKFKGFQLLKNALPKTGFLDAIKRFILFTFAGWLFTNLFQFLPKLLGFIKILSPVLSWFEKGIGLLLEGIVTFIDLGYKAYDSVKSFAKTIGGEKFAEKFDALSGALNTMLNLALIAAMSYGSIGGLGKGKGGKPGIGGGKPPGPAGKPRVTTSGGGTAGRPDIRNPLRQRPTVTTSGGGRAGRPDLRNPLRQRPRVTTGAGGGAGKGLGKVAGKGLGKLGGKLPIVGPLIDFGIRTLIFKEPLGRAAAGAVGAGAGQALGGFLGGSLGGIVGSVVPIAGTLLGAGAGSLVGSLIGGFIGDWMGVSLYDFIESKKDIKTKKMSSGGKVSSTTTGKKKRKGKLKRRQEILEKLQPGKDIGGEKEIEKIYPNPERKFFGITLPSFEGFTNFLFGGKDKDKKKDGKKFPNAIKTLLDVGNALGTSGDWIGSLMRAGVQVALGQKPDAKSLAKTVTSVLQNVTDPAIRGIKSISRELFGFAGGGEVSSMISSTDTLTLERTIESNLRTKFEDSLGIVKTQSRKKGDKEVESKSKGEPEYGPTGKDEMIEENIKKGKSGGVTVSGGNADFWTLVAIASREDSDPQAWADVAQSIYNRAATGMYTGGKNIKDIITASGQYEPTFANPKDWKAISDLATASKASGKSQADLQKVAAAILDQKLQENASNFIGGRTDFMGESQKGSMRPDKGDITRGRGDNYFGWFYNARLKGPAKPPSFGKVSKKESESKPESSSKPGFNLLKPSTWFGGKEGKDADKNVSGGVSKGSVVQWLHGNPNRKGYDAGHAGESNAHDHFSFKSRSAAVAAFSALEKAGYKPWQFEGYTRQGKANAGQPGDHSPTGGHYGPVGGNPTYKDMSDGTAFDIPWATYGTGPISKADYAKSDKAAKIVGAMQGGGLISPSKPNVSIPNSFASYNDPRQSSTLAVQPVIVEKIMPIPMDNPIAFPSSSGSGVNNSVLPSLMQG